MDEEQKKSSLKGRGREIMGGAPDDSENEAANEEQGSGWLPPADEGADESPEFSDDDAVMKWMDVDPEEHRPTVRPDKQLVGEAEKTGTGELYPVPDFDAIFAESDSEPEAQESQEPEPQPEPAPLTDEELASLDEIFAEEDPSFDDVFGDVVEIDAAPVTMADVDTQELPLPDASRFASDEDSGEASPELDEILQDMPPEAVEASYQAPVAAGMSLDDTPEPEEASDGILVDDFGDEPAPRADRRSPDPRDFETDEMPVPARAEEPVETWEQPEMDDLLAPPGQELVEDTQPVIIDDWEEASPPEAVDEREEEPQPEFIDDWEEAPEPEEYGLGEATSILEEEFDDDERAASTADQATLELLAEMTGEIEEAEAQPAFALESTDNEPDAPATEAAAFVSMLERETATDIAEELDEEFDAEPEPTFDEFELPDVDPSEERISEMVEREVATRAMEEPLEVLGIEEAEAAREGVAFALPSSAEDTQPPIATEPLSGSQFSDIPHEEAVPLGEDELETVNLGMAALRRNALDSITPKEPETFSADQLSDDFAEDDLYDDIEADYHAEDFEQALESAGAESLEDTGGAEDEGYPEEEALTRGAGMMVTSGDVPQPPDPFGEREIRRPAREIFQPGMVVPDEELLRLFVDDNRLRELFELIEALQEEIVENVRGERRQSDTYQEELLQASNLLMQSRENYDESRAIVYRIRADLNRERRVDEDIARFRPLITNIYIGLAIFILVLGLLGQLFISVADSVGVPWIGQGYYPALAGAVGALLFGWRTLNRHATVYRDFDPTHVNWYIMNPLLGMLSGFLLYLFLLATAVTTLSSSTFEITGSSPLTLLAAVAVGYNQNVVIALLDAARQRFAPGEVDEFRREER